METIYRFQDHVLENIDILFTWGLAAVAFSVLITQ